MAAEIEMRPSAVDKLEHELRFQESLCTQEHFAIYYFHYAVGFRRLIPKLGSLEDSHNLDLTEEAEGSRDGRVDWIMSKRLSDFETQMWEMQTAMANLQANKNDFTTQTNCWPYSSDVAG